MQDKDVLLPTLSKLLRFLSILGEDANFKISLSTMQILADLALKLRADIRPYLGYVPANLHCKALLFGSLFPLTNLCTLEALLTIMVAGNIKPGSSCFTARVLAVHAIKGLCLMHMYTCTYASSA